MHCFQGIFTFFSRFSLEQEAEKSNYKSQIEFADWHAKKGALEAT